MKSTLEVKNFGPIKNVKLDLRNVNVFIGPQASGKSTLAKLYTIFRTPLSFLDVDEIMFELIDYDLDEKALYIDKFKKQLQFHNIHNFLNDKTYIRYESETHTLEFKSNKLNFNRKFYQKFLRLRELTSSANKDNLNEANSLIREIFLNRKFSLLSVIGYMNDNDKVDNIDLLTILSNFFKNIEKFVSIEKSFSNDELLKILDYLVKAEKNLLSNSTYVPAERIIIPIIKDAALNLQLNDVPIPRHILSFAAEYESSLKEVKEIDLSFVDKNFSFKKIDDEERFYFSSKKSIPLSQASTGIQSLVPLLLPLLQEKKKKFKKLAFVIEEPEINLYPQTQYELLKFLEGLRMDIGELDTTYSHLYTTHSPYVLSSFNNMLYAYKKSVQFKDNKNKLKSIEKIMPKVNWLNPENFNVYQIVDGKAFEILDREIGLIDENIIDDVTENMNEDFQKLMEI